MVHNNETYDILAESTRFTATQIRNSHDKNEWGGGSKKALHNFGMAPFRDKNKYDIIFIKLLFSHSHIQFKLINISCEERCEEM